MKRKAEGTHEDEKASQRRALGKVGNEMKFAAVPPGEQPSNTNVLFRGGNGLMTLSGNSYPLIPPKDVKDVWLCDDANFEIRYKGYTYHVLFERMRLSCSVLNNDKKTDEEMRSEGLDISNDLGEPEYVLDTLKVMAYPFKMFSDFKTSIVRLLRWYKLSHYLGHGELIEFIEQAVTKITFNNTMHQDEIVSLLKMIGDKHNITALPHLFNEIILNLLMCKLTNDTAGLLIYLVTRLCPQQNIDNKELKLPEGESSSSSSSHQVDLAPLYRCCIERLAMGLIKGECFVGLKREQLYKMLHVDIIADIFLSIGTAALSSSSLLANLGLYPLSRS